MSRLSRPRYSGRKTRGITFADGHSNCTGDDADVLADRVGGVYAVDTSVQILDCVVTNCAAYNSAAGREVSFVNCKIVGNRASRGVTSECYHFGCVIDGGYGGDSPLHGGGAVVREVKRAKRMNRVVAILGLMATGAALAADAVKVSDFGYDAADSTAYIRAALTSGARRVTLDRQAGVDIEPDSSRERLRNVTFRNCRSFGNRGNGFEMYLAQLRRRSEPVSITFDGCRAWDNHSETSLNCGKNPGDWVGGLVRVGLPSADQVQAFDTRKGEMVSLAPMAMRGRADRPSQRRSTVAPESVAR